jgi:hypothetical protein
MQRRTWNDACKHIRAVHERTSWGAASMCWRARPPCWSTCLPCPVLVPVPVTPSNPPTRASTPTWVETCSLILFNRFVQYCLPGGFVLGLFSGPTFPRSVVSIPCHPCSINVQFLCPSVFLWCNIHCQSDLLWTYFLFSLTGDSRQCGMRAVGDGKFVQRSKD